MLSAFGVSTLFLASLSFPRGTCGISRARLDPSGLLCALAVAHRPGDCDRSVDPHCPTPCLAREVRKALQVSELRDPARIAERCPTVCPVASVRQFEKNEWPGVYPIWEKQCARNPR